MNHIVVVGCGVIGSAFAIKWASQHHLSIIDRSKRHLQALEKFNSVHFVGYDEKILSQADYVLLAVKPHDLNDAAKKIAPYLSPKTWVMSALAGTSLSLLHSHFPKQPLLRLMPTLTIVDGKGVIGLVETEETEAAKPHFDKLFHPFGRLYWLKETKIEAFTALIGSGPAYLCLIAEAMAEAATVIGFHPQEALDLLLDLWQGTIISLQKSGKSPAELKWNVTSPGGSTIAGIRQMEKCGVRSGVIEGVLAGFARVKNLQNQNGGGENV